MAGLIPFGHRHGISRGFDDLGFWDGSFMRSFFNGSDGFTNFKKDGVLKIVLPKSGEEKKKSQKNRYQVIQKSLRRFAAQAFYYITAVMPYRIFATPSLPSATPMVNSKSLISPGCSMISCPRLRAMSRPSGRLFEGSRPTT